MGRVSGVTLEVTTQRKSEGERETERERDGDVVMDEGCLSPPEVQDHLLRLCCFEDQVIFSAPARQFLYLCPVGSLVI